MRAVVVGVLFMAGCGGCGHENTERDDALVVDTPGGAETDAPIDVAVDMGIDAPPLPYEAECSNALSATCTTAPTTLIPIDFPNTNVVNLARLEDTLYVSTFDMANSQVTAGRVIAVDLVSGTQTTLIPGANDYWIGVARGWVYAAEGETSSASIWRFAPGVTPQQLVSGRPRLRGPVTADDTHVYWAEYVSSTSISVMRRAIAGGNVETVMACDAAWSLTVDDNYVYCADFSHNVFRAPKAGTMGTAIAYSSYPYTGMVHCGTDLFLTSLSEGVIFQLPTPMGPQTTFATVGPFGRYYGLTATAHHFYVTGDILYRVDRTTAQSVPLISTETSESNPVTWKNQLFYFSRAAGIRRCVD